MYVGPWQEYRLGQVFSEQTRLLADAVRAQIQAQIAAEQTQRPQIQLQVVTPQRRQGQAPSYSDSLRKAQSIASTDSARSNFSSSSSLHQQRTGQYSSASSVSQLHTPASALRGGSDANSLPPLQAAARLAVQRMQDSRLRASQAHPLSHIVQAYYPEASSSLTSPAMSNRSLSRQSSAASSASVTASSTSAASVPTRPTYTGNPASFHYRPPPHAIPKKKRPPLRTGKEVVAAHKEHITKLRSLYGLQNGAADAVSPRSAASSSQVSPPGVNLPQVGSPSSPAAYNVAEKPLTLRPAVMPEMSAQTLALYGPIPDDLAARLAFYAATPAQRISTADQQAKEAATVAAAAAAGAAAAQQARLEMMRAPSHSRTRELRPSSRGNPQLLPLTYARVDSYPLTDVSPLPSPSLSGSNSNHRSPDFVPRRLGQHGLDGHVIHEHSRTELPPLSGRARTPSRLRTPLHARPPSHAGSRARLHSSGGHSDSGDFESELNDLLGWAQHAHQDADTDGNLTPRLPIGAQLLHVHE
jgi:hypothetical protein